MSIRPTIFGSKEEERYFAKLKGTWGNAYDVYPQLPFLSVVRARDPLTDEVGQPFVVTDEEYEHLKKTSIDYTLCEKGGAPLLCIEFDGMGAGVSIGSSYHPSRAGLDARKRMLDLKLRVAHGARLPFLVLSAAQFKGLSDAVRLTIADGIIGEVLANRARAERMKCLRPEDFGMSSEDFESLNDFEREAVLEDWVIGVEVACDFEHNPIVREAARLGEKLGVTRWSHGCPLQTDADREKWIEVDYAVYSDKYGWGRTLFRMPNFKSPGAYINIGLAEEIAKLLAMEDMTKEFRASRPPAKSSGDD